MSLKKSIFWRMIAVICCLVNEMSAGQFGSFSYTDDGISITITGYPYDAVGDVVIPESIDGKPVAGIGEWAFYNCTGLTSVVIPESVTSIGYRAFSDCSGLAGVSIPVGVTNIGEKAFVRCTGITNLEISNTVTTIGESAFAACVSLTSVTISRSVTTVGDAAFGACHSLTGIAVDALNPAYAANDGVLFSKNLETLVQYPAGKGGNAVIPNNVTTIANGAFYDCSAITNVTIPSGVTHIGVEAFLHCEQLSSVVIPGSVGSIGALAFMTCSGLTNIEFQEGLSSIGEWAFFDCSGLTNVQLPDSVETIGAYAFARCINLTTVRLSASMARIESETFAVCSRLESVIIPISVKAIGDGAFDGCDRLKSACFSGGAPVMGTGVFGYNNDGFTVYFFLRASGFSSPEWLGYPALEMGEPSAVAPWLISYGFTYNADLQGDPNADGVNLLMAYALDLDPRMNLGGSMPKPVVSDNELGLKFHAKSPGVSYTVERSGDLLNWSSTGISISDPDKDGFRKASVEMDGSACFIRIGAVY